MSTGQTHHGLSPEQLQAYRTDGYVVGDRLLRPERFAALKDHFERKIAALPPGDRPEDMDVPHFTDPELFRWLFDPDVLDVVESVLGPDIALFTSHFFCKPAGDGKSVPWHTDGYFWREMIEPAGQAMTIWLAIDPSTLENGCMKVVPGSHTGQDGRYQRAAAEHSVFDEELDQSQVAVDRALPVQLRPNQYSIHNAGLVHSSEVNRSSLRRCGFTMRYISTGVRFRHDVVGHKHQIFLARGRDRAGNVYADPGRAHPELVATRGKGQRFVGAERG
ncbi:phytanoyl-CoA dioxygenase family protein [Micromonospora fluostatini]|uniref:phytanoyl-CoA dioxygenase family protein n=1 Tax=Micromonospora sp. JCM 30529 TaxID=3421643 RepID=UPI003D17CB1B